VERKSVMNDVSAFPNPIKMNNSLTLLNLQNGSAQAQLLDNNGTAILSEELFVSSGKMQLAIPSTTPGFYILQIIQEGNLQAIKIMVIE